MMFPPSVQVQIEVVFGLWLIGRFYEVISDSKISLQSRHLVSGQGVLVGINVDHDTLHGYADTYAPIESGRGAELKVLIVNTMLVVYHTSY